MDRILILLLGLLAIFVAFLVFAYNQKSKLAEKKVKEYFQEEEEEQEGPEHFQDGEDEEQEGPEHFQGDEEEEPLMSEHFQGSEEEEQPESAMVPPSKIEYFQEDEEEQGPEHFQNEEEEDNGIEYFQSPEEEYGMTQENFQDDDEEVEPFYSGNYNTFNGQVSLESDQHAEYFTNYSDTVEHMSNGPSSRPVVLKLFYADWCGHCQRFKPVFENQLPTAIKQSGLNCKLQAVNADKSPEMVNKYKVQGFPTLILEGADGKTVEYMGDRSAGDIVNFVASNNI